MKKFIKLTFLLAMMIILNPYSINAATYTCESDGVKYESLQAAIDSTTKHHSIKMIADEEASESITIDEDHDITLDLAGHTISDSRKSSNYFMAVGGKLIINDSVGKGLITSGGNERGIIIVSRQNSSLILNGGTIKQNDSPSPNQFGIYSTEGKITINNGTVEACFPLYFFGDYSNIDATINGGKFISERNSVMENLNLTINGGYFSSSAPYSRSLYILVSKPDMPYNIKLNGGEYHGQRSGIDIDMRTSDFSSPLNLLIDEDHYASDYSHYQYLSAFSSAKDLYIYEKKVPTANLFTCSIPANSTYDGLAKAATVSSTTKGLGEFSIYYINTSNNSKLINAPTNIGEYDVYASIKTGDFYKAAELKLGHISIKKAPAIKTETPKTETPKTESPKTESPKTESPKTETPKTNKAKALTKFTIGKTQYKITSSKKGNYKVTIISYGNKTATKYTIPNTVKYKKKTYKVVGISSKAFSKCKKLKTITVKSKYLTKKTVKNSLKGSKITTVKISKALFKKYKSYFTKANCGKRVKITK